MPIKKVLIVENKTTLYTTLTLPKMYDTIAIFGSGYSVYNLKNVHWFARLELLYWGDIDVQGFEILSQFRGYFPLTKSVLMDIVTFEKFFENDLGTQTNICTLHNLTESEQKLYEILKTNNWRLEQEKIPFDYVNEFFFEPRFVVRHIGWSFKMPTHDQNQPKSLPTQIFMTPFLMPFHQRILAF